MPYPRTQAIIDKLLSDAIEKYGEVAVEFVIEHAMLGGPAEVTKPVVEMEKAPVDQASLNDLVDKTRGRE
jgi:hypothetical protein